MRPARSMSWWLTSSASEGASLRVPIKNLDARMADTARIGMRTAQRCLWRAMLWKNRSRILTYGGVAMLDQGRLPSECRHRSCQCAQRGVLGKAGQSARVAVSPGRHQARRVAGAGDVPRARRGGRAAAGARAHSRPHARLAALRGAVAVGAARLARQRTVARSRSGTCCGSWAATATCDCVRSGHPEFDAWRWHEYWVPLDAVIEFKREVYRQALNELRRFLNADRRLRRAPRGRVGLTRRAGRRGNSIAVLNARHCENRFDLSCARGLPSPSFP